MQVADPEYDDGQTFPSHAGVADPYGTGAGVAVQNAGMGATPRPDPIVAGGPFFQLTPPKPGGMHPLIIAFIVIAFVYVVTRS